MATTTTRLLLRKPADPDDVNVGTDISGNMQVLDDKIDVYASTTTRPAAPFQGQKVYESDSGLLAVHNGSLPASGGWVYPHAKARRGTAAARPTGAVTAGYLYQESDTGNLLSHNGSAPVSGNWDHLGMTVVSATSQILQPRTGQMVYDTSQGIMRYSGSAWKCVKPVPTGASTTWPFGVWINGAGTSIAGSTNVTATYPTSVLTPGTQFCTVSGTNNTTFTVQKDGVYALTASLRHGATTCQVTIYTGTTFSTANALVTANGNLSVFASTLEYLQAGIQIQVNYFASGATTVTTGWGRACGFKLVYMGMDAS